MGEYEFHDINETVKLTLIERAHELPFIDGVAEALEKAASAAENPDPSEPRSVDLVGQVQAQMSAEFLTVDSVHIARFEFYANPVNVAYAFLADAADDWFDEEEIANY